jgi:hypothetical protein
LYTNTDLLEKGVKPMLDAFAYDVFISYSSQDKAWVQGELLSQLEAVGLRVFIDFRDFDVGAPSITEMERGVIQSRKTILVLTPAYLKSQWTEFENLMLQTLDPARGRRLIPLLREKCDLPTRIGMLTYVDFTDPAEQTHAWQRLFRALQAVPPPTTTTAPAPPPPPAASNAAEDLRQKLIARASLSDLKDLCFSLGINYENYPNTTRDFVRELVREMANQGELERLIAQVKKQMPWVLR